MLIAAHVDDRHYCRQGLYVVDEGGATPNAFHGGEGRFDTGIAAFAFEGFDQRRLFTADIGAGAGVYINFAVKTGTQDVFSQPAVGFCLVDGPLEDIGDPGVFAPDIDIGSLAAQRIGRDDQPFDQQVRQELHQVTILERTGFGFIRIASKLTGYAVGLGQKTPFQTRREPGAATATQTTLLHFFRHLVRGHILQRLFHTGITTFTTIYIIREDAFHFYLF